MLNPDPVAKGRSNAETSNGEEPGGEAAPSKEQRLAKDRTILSAERTFAAWLRTGLAFLVVGIAAEKLFVHGAPGAVVGAFATFMTLCAALCFAVSGWRVRSSQEDGHEPTMRHPPRLLILALSLGLTLVSGVGAVALWWL